MSLRHRQHSSQRVALAFVAALLLLASPLRHAWANVHVPWFSPWVVWALLVGLSFWAGARRSR